MKPTDTEASAESALQDEISAYHELMTAAKSPGGQRHFWRRMVDRIKRRSPRLRKKMGRKLRDDGDAQ